MGGAMPNAFERFEEDFGATRIALLSNWRSHRDLVRIKHVIAARIDPEAECPEARAEREVDGDVAGSLTRTKRKQPALRAGSTRGRSASRYRHPCTPVRQ